MNSPVFRFITQTPTVDASRSGKFNFGLAAEAQSDNVINDMANRCVFI